MKMPGMMPSTSFRMPLSHVLLVFKVVENAFVPTAFGSRRFKTLAALASCHMLRSHMPACSLQHEWQRKATGTHRG